MYKISWTASSIYMTEYAGSRDCVVNLQSPRRTPHRCIHPTKKTVLRPSSCEFRASVLRTELTTRGPRMRGVHHGDCRFPRRNPEYSVICICREKKWKSKTRIKKFTTSLHLNNMFITLFVKHI